MIDATRKEVTLRGAASFLFSELDEEVLLDGPRGTGKTFAVLRYCDHLMRTYPGIRIVWARDTLRNLRGSAMQIFEDFILWPGHPALLSGGSRENRTSYRYGPDPQRPGHIECIGLDNIGKTQSKEADVIVVFETTTPGVTEHHWTVLTGMLRGRAIPHPLCAYPDGIASNGETIETMMGRGYFRGGVDEEGRPLFFRRMIADCNPTDESHWVWRRFERGHMARYRSKHVDNPMVDEAYLDKLRALPPVLRARWLEGKWVAAENLVWDTYQPQHHVVSVEVERDPLTSRTFLRVNDWVDDQGLVARLPVVGVIAGFDWGHSDPAVLLVGAVTQDGRLFVLREWYQPKIGYPEWAARIAKCVDELGLQCVRMSAERPEGIDILNKLLGPRHGREVGGIVQPSDRRRMTKTNGDLGGLDVVRELFRQNRLFFARDMSQKVDAGLDEKGLFTTVLQEIPAYVKGVDAATGQVLETPDEASVDHGCEALRYLVMDSWFREFAKPKDVRYIPPPGTVGYEVGTPAERLRLMELQKRRSSARMDRGRLGW